MFKSVDERKRSQLVSVNYRNQGPSYQVLDTSRLVVIVIQRTNPKMMYIAKSYTRCEMLPLGFFSVRADFDSDAVIGHWVSELPKQDARPRCADLIFLFKLRDLSSICAEMCSHEGQLP